MIAFARHELTSDFRSLSTACVFFFGAMSFAAILPAAEAKAQETQVGASRFPVTDKLPPKASKVAQSSSGSPEEEEDFIKASRPDTADPAEFQKPGVLQVEYGVDADFEAEDFQNQIVLPLTLRFAASERLLLQLDLDTVTSQRSEGERRMTGVGDTRIGFQIVALKDQRGQPALAFAYFVKLPSASEQKQLGTGRVDHRIVSLLSKKIGETDLDFNLAYLNVGREDSDRRASGGQAALSMTRKLNSRFSFIGELSGQSEKFERERGIYPLAAIAFKPNRRLQFDFGARAGIGAEAPRVGVFGGVTVGVANLYKSGR